ncbi:YIP1 family protein [Tropicimonas sp. IMCC34043]|uniref:YIP1 family protein n=1 Tax=Tropicimonas sp. IMCC34043 TaxID=2248760 RepID=UPI000E266419|nr:YIP1 family protein [Tropicimonas sp. IMCC34043]
MSSRPLPLAGLVLATFRNPRGTLRFLMDRSVPVTALWQALVLLAVLIVLFEQTLQHLAGGTMPPVTDDAAADPVAAMIWSLQSTVLGNPLMVASFQVLFCALGVLALYRVGRMFGGTGTLQQSLTAMNWFLVIYLAMLLVSSILVMVVPVVGLMAVLAIVVVNGWLATVFTCELHGFREPFLVLLGIVATTVLILLALGMLVSIVLSGTIGDTNVL